MQAGRIVEQGTVFDLFAQPQHPVTASFVQSVVHAHQGTVEVASVEGEGSCFTLRLPCHQAAGRLQASGGAV